MNLRMVREAVFDELDWSPKEAPEAVSRTNRFVNRELQRMVLKFPELFVRDVMLYTMPDVTADGDDANDRLLSIVDAGATLAWVMELQLSQADAETAGWTGDGSWEGRQIEIKDNAGIWHSNIIREVWVEVGLPARYRLSLVRPIEAVNAGVEFIVWTPQLWLPSDVVQIRKVWVGNSIGEYPVNYEERGRSRLQPLSTVWSLREGYESEGSPGVCYQGESFQLPGPEAAPPLTDATGDPAPTWDGPDPAGTFEYRLTYTWGLRDTDTRSPLGFQEPMFESPPSEASAEKVVVWGGPAIIVNLPIPDWVLDHYWALGGGAAYARDQHSGLRVRIWRRRVATDTSAGPIVPYRGVSVTHGWCLLAEVGGHTATYQDDGSVLVDRWKRLKTTHENRSLVMYPRPTERSGVRVNAVTRPPQMEFDTDTAAIPEEGMDYLIHRVATLVAISMDHAQRAGIMLDLAMDAERDISKSRSSLGTAPIRRRLTRGGRH